MNVIELIEIALANGDDRPVEVMALEPAEFSTEAVAALAELVFELVSNAIAFSAPDEKVRVAGLFVQDSYLISISDRGVGISEGLIGVLNQILEDPSAAGRNPELALGLRFVARLAARQGLAVRLVPGVPGTTARVTVPGNLVRRIESGDRLRVDEPGRPGDAALQDAREKPTVDFTPIELEHQGISHIFAPSESARRETEAFLEKVFAPLRRDWQEPDRPVRYSSSSGANVRVENAQVEVPSPFQREPATAAVLQVRVPGESFPLTEDDSPSTAAAEAAIDIRSALSTFDEGRRSAEKAVDRDSGQNVTTVPARTTNPT